ncbi:MAG: hypothetical protein JNJ48_01075 [Phycisphaerae bacterium]|nr:hypothetical protein [Phycisphaerae bacterium]
MPPSSRLRVSALAELARQLRYIPAEAARRHLSRVEALADRVDPAGTYPEDWVVLQVTGFRPDRAEPALIVGAALLADLPALAERLSITARQRADDLPAGQWLAGAELAARWHTTQRTLARLRRRGLLCRRALGPGGRWRTLYPLASVRRLESAGLAGGPAPARSRRTTAAERAELADRIAEAASRGVPRSRAIRQAAAESGRTVPTVRRAAGPPPGGRQPVLSAPRRAALLRLWSAGVPARELRQRFGRSAAAVHRAVNQARAERLRTLDLTPGFEPARDLVLADARLLEPAPVRLALGRPGAATLAEHLRQTTDAGWPDPAVEQQRARAYAALKALCRQRLARLNAYAPHAADLDIIETHLLWAARLKAELIRGQQMLVLKTVEARLGRRLETIAGAAARRLVISAIDAIAESVDRHDPFRAGRLAAPAGIAVNRAMARWEATDGPASLRSRQPARAEPLVDPAAVELPDWTRSVAPWQPFLEAPERARHVAQPADARLLAERFGLAGERPRTLSELAREHAVALHVMARRVNAALRQCAAPDQNPQPRSE